MRPTTALMLPLLVLPAALCAQEIHQVRDAGLVEGRVTHRGKEIALLTPFGELRVPRSHYEGPVRPRREVEAAYKKRVEAARQEEGTGPRELAAWCRRHGYQTGLREQLNALLLRDVEDPFAREVLRSIADRYVVHPSGRGDRGRDHRDLARFLFEVLAKRDLVGSILTYEKARELPVAVTYNPAMDALRQEPDPTVRWVGAAILARHRDAPGRIRHLLQHALMDRAPAVRTQAVRSLKVTGDPVFASLFADRLDHEHSGIRANAADALAELELGKETAVPALILALANGSNAPRNHVMRLTTRAYVKDFNVEIARAAVIADPVVDTVSEGSVLDVAVVGVTEELGRYRNALRHLTGTDFGYDAEAWARWWLQKQEDRAPSTPDSQDREDR